MFLKKEIKNETRTVIKNSMILMEEQQGEAVLTITSQSSEICMRAHCPQQL
jgi:hypothetical protein